MPGKSTKRSPATASAKAHAKPGKAKAKAKAPAKPRVHKHPHFPIAYIKYYDHCWLQSRELEKIQEAEPYVVEEVGFLLQETDRFVTVAKERNTEGEKGRVQYDDVTIIMRSDILDIRTFPLE